MDPLLLRVARCLAHKFPGFPDKTVAARFANFFLSSLSVLLVPLASLAATPEASLAPTASNIEVRFSRSLVSMALSFNSLLASFAALAAASLLALALALASFFALLAASFSAFAAARAAAAAASFSILANLTPKKG